MCNPARKSDIFCIYTFKKPSEQPGCFILQLPQIQNCTPFANDTNHVLRPQHILGNECLAVSILQSSQQQSTRWKAEFDFVQPPGESSLLSAVEGASAGKMTALFLECLFLSLAVVYGGVAAYGKYDPCNTPGLASRVRILASIKAHWREVILWSISNHWILRCIEQKQMIYDNGCQLDPIFEFGLLANCDALLAEADLASTLLLHICISF